MGLIRLSSNALLVGVALIATPLHAQDATIGPAIGSELFVSSDSDDTSIIRLAGDFDITNDGAAKRLGVRLENVWYDFDGIDTVQRQRAFLQAGDSAQGWTWAARVGSDGDNVIGSASIHDDTAFRKEFFIERDIIETPQGLERELYSTFLGAAIDLPFDDRNTFTALAGWQEFSGSNERYHLRGTYIHVLNEGLGLSAQLRGRYFHSTTPGEFDYYSPESYLQILPVLQIRRFVDGWRLRAVGGIGAQRDTNSGWSQANFAQLQAESPSRGPWKVSGELTYSETPANSALASEGYEYFQLRLSARRRL